MHKNLSIGKVSQMSLYSREENENTIKKQSPVIDTVGMVLNPDVLNSLRRLGLNQYEAKAYFALSMFGSNTAGELSEYAELPRPRIYDVVTKLQEKGFVQIQNTRPVKYAAIPISEAVVTLKKQREAGVLQEVQKIDEIGKELMDKIKSVKVPSRPSVEESVWTLKGREAIYSKLASMVQGARKHVVVSSTAEGLMSKYKAHSKEFEKAANRGVKLHFIAPISPSNAGELTKIANLQNKEMPTRMVLADDQALLFLTEEKTKPEDEVGLWIGSPHLVSTLKQNLGIPQK